MRSHWFLTLTLLLGAMQARSQVNLPLRHLCLTSPYGIRIHPVTGKERFHAGVDLRARGDTAYAVICGLIIKTGYNYLLGRFIHLSDGPFCVTYGHLSRCFVVPGDTVITNAPLGITGVTGRVTGEHLHFALQFNHHYIDPLIFLSAAFNKISNP